MPNDIWRLHQYIGYLCLSIGIAYFFMKRYGIAIGFAIAYTLVSAVTMFNGMINYWGGELQQRIDTNSAISWGQAIGSLFAVTLMTTKQVGCFLSCIVCLAVIDCILVLIYDYGMFNASSMDSTFIAMIFPLMISYRKWSIKSFLDFGMHTLEFVLLVCLPIATIISASGSTAFVVLSFSFAGWAIAHKKWKLATLSGAILGVGYLVEMSHNVARTRPMHWKNLMGWWNLNADVLFGTGTGSFQWISPFIQLRQKTNDEYLLWMHNEYLQSVFEQGIFGFIIYMVVLWIVIKKSIKSPWLFSTMLGIVASSITYSPLRFFLSQFFVLLICRVSLDDEMK